MAVRRRLIPCSKVRIRSEGYLPFRLIQVHANLIPCGSEGISALKIKNIIIVEEDIFILIFLSSSIFVIQFAVVVSNNYRLTFHSSGRDLVGASDDVCKFSRSHR